MGKVKVWKNGGKEDRLIEKLISEGSFTKNTKACSMKQKFPAMFSDFSDNVIRNHLNDIKRKKGLYLFETGDGGSSDVEQEEDNRNDECSNEPASSTSVVQQDVTVNHQNYPFVCELYKDPDSRLDTVLVMVNVPGGAQNVKIDLNNDGTSAIVTYNWAKPLYNVDDLFKNMVAGKELTMHHPKVLAVKNALEKCRNRIDVAPTSVITVKLPIKVQTAAETWKVNGIVRDGMQVVMGEYVGFVSDYHKQNVDSCVIFDK